MSNQSNSKQTAYNKTVEAVYHNILRAAKRMLSTLLDNNYRHSLERKEIQPKEANTILHELVTPILYLCLEQLGNGCYKIYYGFEQVVWLTDYSDDFSHVTCTFVRTLYQCKC